MTREEIKKDLMRDEGFSECVYLDSKGIPTVGWGHAFLDRDPPKVGTRFTVFQCLTWLDRDLEQAETDYRRTGLNLDPICRGVVIQMLFNLGLPRFMGFKNFIAALKREDKHLAALEMLDSKWHREDVGARAVRLARLVFNS